MNERGQCGGILDDLFTDDMLVCHLGLGIKAGLHHAFNGCLTNDSLQERSNACDDGKIERACKQCAEAFALFNAKSRQNVHQCDI